MSVTLGIVHPDSLEQADLDNIKRGLEFDYSGATVEDVLNTARIGACQIWVLDAENGRGVMVTIINEYRGGKELFTWLLAGKGMRPHVDLIFDVLIDFAKDGGCSWLRGLTVKWFADRLVAEKGYEAHSVCVIRRI
jgi:hypothetical protein